MSWENEKNVLTNWLKCLEKLIKMSWQNFKGYKTNFFRGKNSRLKNNYTVEFTFNIRHTGKNGRYPPNGNCFKFGGLNPYSGGTWFLSRSCKTSARRSNVLILILVELDFWATKSGGKNINYTGLNPYSGGTWFLSWEKWFILIYSKSLNPYSGGTWFLSMDIVV